jgi:hypothetical protein
LLADIVGFVDDVIPAGDVDVGDVIVLPDADAPVLVSRVHLGQGGLILTVASASGATADEEERPVSLVHHTGLLFACLIPRPQHEAELLSRK